MHRYLDSILCNTDTLWIPKWRHYSGCRQLLWLTHGCCKRILHWWAIIYQQRYVDELMLKSVWTFKSESNYFLQNLQWMSRPMYGTWVLWQEKMSSSFQMQRSLIQHGGQEINQILFPSYPLILDPEVAMVLLLPHSWKIWLEINWCLGGVPLQPPN